MVERLSRVDPCECAAAWREFLDTHGDFIYRIARRFGGAHEDDAADLFLYIIDALAPVDQTGSAGPGGPRFRAYLKTLVQYPDSTFAAWLAQVCANLCRDWRREHYGRRTAPKAVEDMGTAAVELFKSIYWQGRSRAETLHRMLAERHVADENEFESLALDVECALGEAQRWSLLASGNRRSSPMSLDSDGFGDDGKGGPIDTPDRQPGPEAETERTLAAEKVGLVCRIFEKLLAGKPETVRRAIAFWSENTLKAREIAQLSGLLDADAVYREVEKFKEELRRLLAVEAISWEELAPAVHLLNGSLEKIAKLRGKAGGDP
ncbi:MAG: sigma-70 family RNA polymerase sigma factor [Myxococcales bacterium]|nr:MAG: sigma-70 family RNA polymerase sigma factor [Myxococcales bacterium]